MILTTTPAIEGHTIREYKGVVFGEVITGVNFLKDFAASIPTSSADAQARIRMSSSRRARTPWTRWLSAPAGWEPTQS